MVGGSNPLTPTIVLASKKGRNGNKVSYHNKSDGDFVNTPDIRKIFFDLLSSFQKEFQLSDRSLAKDLGISAACLSFIKSGKRSMNAEIATRLFSVLPDLQDIFSEFLKKKYPFSANTYLVEIESQ